MRLAVVMPAYNEAESIADFLAEIAAHLSPVTKSLVLIVVDDASTDGTAAKSVGAAVGQARIETITHTANRGHGPSVLDAYRAGLESGADLVMHLDGDGQFLGVELPAVLALAAEHEVVHGVRRRRTDPWYRKILTGVVAALTRAVAGGHVPDVNTPLRVYRPDVLRQLLSNTPSDAIVPHVHFSILERRLATTLGSIDVTNIPRRGAEPGGTMWGRSWGRRMLPPIRLLRFSFDAAVEIWRYRLDPARPHDAVPTVE